MEVYRRSSWLLLLLGVSLLATALQGVQGEVESVGPTESECRPYIEKALKELEQGEAEHAAPPETDSKEDLPTVEITTDDSDRPEDDGDDDAEGEGKDSTGSAETENADEETTKEDEEDKSGDEEKPEEGAESTEDEERIEPEAASQEVEAKSEEDIQEGEDVEAATEEVHSEEVLEGTASSEDTESYEQAQADQPETYQEGIDEQQGEAEESHEVEQPSQEDEEEEEVAQAEVSAEEEAAASKETEEAAVSHEEAASSHEEAAASHEEVSKEEEVEASKEEEVGASKEEDEHQGAAEEVEESSKEASQEEAQASAEEASEHQEEPETSTEEKASAEAEGSVEEPEAKSDGEEEAPASQEASASQEAEASLEAEASQEGGEASKEEVETRREEAEASKEAEGSQDAEASKEHEASVEASQEAEASKEEPEGSKEEAAGEGAQASAEDKQSAEDDVQKSQEEEPKSEESEGVKEEVASKETIEKEGTSPEQESKEGQEDESKEGQEEGSKEGEVGEASEGESVEGVAEVEELIQEPLDMTEIRPRDHMEQLLKLDRQSSDVEKMTDRMSEIILRDLKKLYDNAIKPLETLYKYRDLSNRHFGDAEIFSKPLILFMGPWSGGKSSIINYLLGIEYNETSLHTGAEPSPAYFNILMYGDEPEILDGTELAADYTFSGLQKFGQGLEERLRGYKLPSKLLEKVNIVEIPGILEVRKQVSRVFPFNDACQWFIDRADIIFLVYDPSKLDVGPETEAILDQLKGREHQTRIVLNKADQVKPEELMRVQGALIWNISPLMSSAQPPVMYTTSLWSRPYEVWAPVKLLQAQERAFLRDLRSAIDKRIDNKIASARRFAVRVRNHAKMVDCYLTTYYNHKSVFGNRKQISDEIINHPQDYHIYEGLSTLTNISRYDLPDPEVYRDFFKLNALYDFQQLSATCTYFRGCPINRLDVAIAYDLPELVGKHKRLVETAVHDANVATPGS